MTKMEQAFMCMLLIPASGQRIQNLAARALLNFSTITDGKGANDCDGHGTFVAAIIGGKNYGVAKSSILHSVRVLDCSGSGPVSGVIAGIDWVTKNRVKPAVANVSIEADTSKALNDAVTRSINSGVVYTVAAGNGGVDACTKSPSSTPSAITVGATDSLDQRSGFSNFGRCVDIFAPGDSITSAYANSNTDIAIGSGTSAAFTPCCRCSGAVSARESHRRSVNCDECYSDDVNLWQSK